MKDYPARHAPTPRDRAVFKIDHVVLLSVIAGIALAVLSSIDRDVPRDPPPAPADGPASFP